MKSAAIGIAVHSGWGALVAVSSEADVVEVIGRRRIEVIDRKASGAAQPYHFAEKLKLTEAKNHIDRCSAASGGMALAATRDVLSSLRSQNHKVVAAVILLSSGGPLPDFEKILASHALIHAAEGEFFRRAFREAFQQLKIPVTGIRARELDERAKGAFGKAASQLQRRIAGMGRALGPPWTQDQKSAALAAAVVLAKRKT